MRATSGGVSAANPASSTDAEPPGIWRRVRKRDHVPHLYWAETTDANNDSTKGAVMMAPLGTDAGVGSPVPLVTGESNVGCLALTPEGLFWCSRQVGVRWLPTGASTATLVGPPGTFLRNPDAITSNSNGIYWFDEGIPGDQDPVLLTASFSSLAQNAGSPPTQLLTTDHLISSTPCSTTASAVDSNTVYWLGGVCGIGQLALRKFVLSSDAGAINLLPTTDIESPSLRMVLGTQWIYFGAHFPSGVNPGHIFGAPLEPGDAAIVESSVSAVSVAADANYIYWADERAGAVLAAPLGGGSTMILVSGQTAPYDIAVDATSVYWTNKSNPGVVGRVAKP